MKLVISPKALNDLDELWLYIAQDDPVAADRVIDLNTVMHSIGH